MTLHFQGLVEGKTTVCNPVTFTDHDPAIAMDIGSQPYNGQFTGMRVVSVTTN